MPSSFPSFKKRFFSRKPAESWEHALLIGNGALGAMVMGRPLDETIILNHAGLFAPWKKPLPPVEMAAHLPEIRRLIAAGKFREASEIPGRLAEEAGWGEKRWTDPLTPVCDLRIVSPENGVPADYARGVDFETGTAWVEWDEADGRMRREAFASRADDVLVVRQRRLNGALFDASVRFEPRPMHPGGEDEIDYWEKAVPPEQIVGGFRTESEGNTLRYRHAFLRAWPGSVRGAEAGALLLLKSGETTVETNVLRVRNAEEMMLLIRCRPVHEDSPDEDLVEALRALTPDFDELLERHAAVHGALFNRVELDLGASEAEHDRPTEDLIAESSPESPSLALLEKQFHAARYNIVSCTGLFPPPLQGLWTGTWSPPWSGDYTQNGNVQCAIAGLLSGATPELMDAYLRYEESLLSDFRENARRMFDARGIHVASRTSSHGLNNHFDAQWQMAFWTAGAAWAAHFFYDCYLYAGDREFLRRRALPFMKEAALFYEDFLVESEDGKYVFTPSYSPENTPAGEESQTCVNATMDMAAARELLENLIAACETLGVEEEGAARWKALLAKLPPYLINDDGAVKEWITPALKENYEHRHCSHLYALFDGLPPSVAVDQALRSAFLRAAELRMDIRKRHQGGVMAFGLVQLGLAVSSLRRSGMSGEIIRWLSANYWHPNLATTHDPKSLFNMDLSGGFPALIHKMLAFCDEPGVVDLLPACPPDWPNGRIAGVACRGGVTVVDLRWSDGEIHAVLRSKTDQTVRLRVPGDIEHFDAPEASLDDGLLTLPLKIEKDIAVSLRFRPDSA